MKAGSVAERGGAVVAANHFFSIHVLQCVLCTMRVGLALLLDAPPPIRGGWVGAMRSPGSTPTGPGRPGGGGAGRPLAVVLRVGEVEPLEVRPPAPPHLLIILPGGLLLAGEVSYNVRLNIVLVHPGGRGLHSSTFRLNVSAFYGLHVPTFRLNVTLIT